MSALPIFFPLLLVLIALLWRKQRRERVGPLPLYAWFVVGAVGLSAVTSLLWFDDNHGRVFGMMALLFVAGFVAAPIYLLGVAIIDWAPARTLARRTALVGSVLLAAIAIDALLIEPHALATTHHTIRAPRMARERLRIVVLADLQTAEPGEYERDALAQAAALEPDLLLFPGDYVQSPFSDYADAVARLRAAILAAGLDGVPAFAVQGDVDPEGSERSANGGPAPNWRDVFSGTSVTATSLTQTYEQLGISVTALSYEDSRNATLRIARRPGFHVVFGHRPDFALGEIEADLLIAGHTHGGQVQLPGLGPVMTLSEVPRDWADGLTLLPGNTLRHLVVSRGIGMERGEAPPIRFLCTPELVVIDVLSDAAAAPP